MPRRSILIWADLGHAAALLSVPIAYALDALTLWQLYVVGVTTGVLTGFFDVAYMSYLPSLVERRQVGALGQSLAFLAMVLSPVRALREVPEPEAEVEPDVAPAAA